MWAFFLANCKECSISESVACPFFDNLCFQNFSSLFSSQIRFVTFQYSLPVSSEHTRSVLVVIFFNIKKLLFAI